LVQELIKQVCEIAQKNNANSVSRVVVKVGPFSGIVVDSFCFAFDVIKTEKDVTKNAYLEIETDPVRCKCIQCGHEFEKDATKESMVTGLFNISSLGCPRCRATKLMPLSGDELLLIRVEME